jgi:leader peptidase (prepilin peptidase)/N-methyltransferase
VFLAWAATLVVLFATDLDQRLLPDVITLPRIPIAIVLVLAGLDPFVARATCRSRRSRAGGADRPLALSIPFGAGIGLGDVKFLVGFGLLAGAERFLVGLVAGILLAGVVIIVAARAPPDPSPDVHPYGPFLILGALWRCSAPADGGAGPQWRPGARTEAPTAGLTFVPALGWTAGCRMPPEPVSS